MMNYSNERLLKSIKNQCLAIDALPFRMHYERSK
jgi:hypothetical protein